MSPISLHDATDVEILGHYRLRRTFSDGLAGDVDASHVRAWGGVLALLRDPDAFAQVRVDPEIGTITWPGGADLAPEVLHERVNQALLLGLRDLRG
jgi:hypothetical protein